MAARLIWRKGAMGLGIVKFGSSLGMRSDFGDSIVFRTLDRLHAGKVIDAAGSGRLGG